MTPHWNGTATVTDAIDGAGARRLAPTGGGPGRGLAGRRCAVGFSDAGRSAPPGRVASTLGRRRLGRAACRTAFSPQAESLTRDRRRHVPACASGTVLRARPSTSASTPRSPRRPGARRRVAASQAAAAKGWSQLFAATPPRGATLWSSDIAVAGQPELQDWIRSNLYALWSSIRAGRDDEHLAGRAELGQLRRADLLGRRDVDVPEPAGDAPGGRRVGDRVPAQDAARGVRERRRARLRRHASIRGTAPGRATSREECHSVDPPHCQTQIHLQGDIALATWQYYLATGDTRVAARATGDPARGSPSSGPSRVTRQRATAATRSTMSPGPDEYSNGVDDGVFTNAGAALALRNATRAAQIAGRDRAGGMDDDRGRPADAVRRDQPGLPAVRRLRGQR